MMALLFDQADKIPEITAISAFMMVVLVLLVFLDSIEMVMVPFGFIIFVSVLIRVVFLFQGPFLSDDIFRHEFDGRMLISGHNPYSAPPAESSVLYPVLASLGERVNHPDLVTIYPPAAQLVSCMGVFTGAEKGIRLVLIILDIFTVFMVSRLLKNNGASETRSVLYAWNPLTVLETASSGHMDAAAVFFLVLGLYSAFLLLKDEPLHLDSDQKNHAAFQAKFAGLALSLSFLTKLFPVVFLPFFFLLFLNKSGKRSAIYFASGFCAGVILLCFAFMPGILNSLVTLDKYARNWEFSGFVFRMIRNITGNGAHARLAVTLAFAFLCLISYVHAFYWLKEKIRIFKYLYWLSLSYLILTPTLHPWYAVYLGVFLPFVPRSSGICLSFAVLLSYRVMIPYKMTGQWIESDLMSLLIFSAPIAALMLAWGARLFISRDRSYEHRLMTS